jgi:hypothetical protein
MLDVGSGGAVDVALALGASLSNSILFPYFVAGIKADVKKARLGRAE